MDLEPVAVGTPSDPDFRLEPLPAGSETEVSVSAINRGGESMRSEVVVVKTPDVQPKLLLEMPGDILQTTKNERNHGQQAIDSANGGA